MHCSHKWLYICSKTHMLMFAVKTEIIYCSEIQGNFTGKSFFYIPWPFRRSSFPTFSCLFLLINIVFWLQLLNPVLLTIRTNTLSMLCAAFRCPSSLQYVPCVSSFLNRLSSLCAIDISTFFLREVCVAFCFLSSVKVRHYSHDLRIFLSNPISVA